MGQGRAACFWGVWASYPLKPALKTLQGLRRVAVDELGKVEAFPGVLGIGIPEP